MSEPEKVCSRCGERYASDVIFCPKDGTPMTARKTEIAEDAYLGLIVAGQFRIEQLIGIGAMGRVYRAHQSGIERDVAIKILHRELLRNPTVIGRFHREAKVASRLVHPNVVGMLMTGELDRVGPDVGGEAYLVMEFLDGISLRSALAAAGGAMPLPRALHVMLQVCDAVGEAHSQNIVHRDLKPENVMLVRRGDDADFVKVLDFGVARIDWADASMATQAGTIFGTARYISPEGAQGNRVAAAGDVYSLATMLFQCLSGDTPFDGESPVAILLKHTSEPAPDVRSRHRSSYVPEPIARVIAANLAKSPGDRCRDAREFGRAVVEAARAAGLSPDELVMRSTLVGAGRGGFSLQSMERTKQMNLSPEAEAKMALGGRTSATELTEKPPADAEHRGLNGGPTSSAKQARSGTEPPESGISASGRVAKTRTDRDSTVDPTLSDEPVSDLASSRSSAGSLPPHPSFPPLSSLPTPRPSSPSFTGHSDEAGAGARRWVAIFACFVLGVALSAFVAHRLGAFAEHESPVEAYAKRARQALAVGALDEPPHENVKQITDTALDRWPDAPSIVAVRRDAARSATERARGFVQTDPARASQLAGLARQFDPDYEPARKLLTQLATPATQPVAPPPPIAPSASTRSSKPKLPRVGPAPATVPAPPPPPAEPTPAAAPSSTGGGRWL